jgi:hypothetical protein
MAQTTLTPEEIAARAREIYEREIRAHVEPAQTGKYLVLDIESGAYEIDEDLIRVMKHADEQHPDGVFHILRIGHRAMGRLGARAIKTNP